MDSLQHRLDGSSTLTLFASLAPGSSAVFMTTDVARQIFARHTGSGPGHFALQVTVGESSSGPGLCRGLESVCQVYDGCSRAFYYTGTTLMIRSHSYNVLPFFQNDRKVSGKDNCQRKGVGEFLSTAIHEDDLHYISFHRQV